MKDVERGSRRKRVVCVVFSAQERGEGVCVFGQRVRPRKERCYVSSGQVVVVVVGGGGGGEK